MEGSKLTFVPDYFVNVVKSSQQEKKNNALKSVKIFLSLSSKHNNSKWHNLLIPNIHNVNSLICSINECTRLQIFSYCSSAHPRTQLKWLSVFRWQILTLILWTRQGSMVKTWNQTAQPVTLCCCNRENMGTSTPCTISITVWLNKRLFESPQCFFNNSQNRCL